MSMPGVPVVVPVLAMLGLVAAVLIVPVLVMPMLAVPMLIVLVLVAPVPVVIRLAVRLAVSMVVSMVVVAAVPMAVSLGPLIVRQRIRHPACRNLALHRVFMLMRVCMPPKHQLLDDEEHAEPDHQSGADTVRPSRSHALHRLRQ